ncbi:hypothetical protein [Amycolatopsis sp. lyj-84]|uniref:hypothetical protein n=1 Tax=Amycolatopsis sp. lyj-84 TaxID=2789284 RepID=UPI00397E6CCE
MSAGVAAGVTVPAATAASPLRVQILMFDGVEEQDFIAPVEVLGLAGKLTGGALQSSWCRAAATRTGTVRARTGSTPIRVSCVA